MNYSFKNHAIGLAAGAVVLGVMWFFFDPSDQTTKLEPTPNAYNAVNVTDTVRLARLSAKKAMERDVAVGWVYTAENACAVLKNQETRTLADASWLLLGTLVGASEDYDAYIRTIAETGGDDSTNDDAVRNVSFNQLCRLGNSENTSFVGLTDSKEVWRSLHKNGIDPSIIAAEQ